MEISKKAIQIEDDNIVNQIIFRFVPYWPLFIVLMMLAGLGGLIYLRYSLPVYETTASVLIKDEKKGLDDSKIMESLNIFSPNNIVENEIEVLQSRGLMNGVVNALHLYAPVFSEGHVRSVTAYTSSPIVVEAFNPDALDTTLGENKIYFKYDSSKKLVNIENKNYPLNQWVNTSYGKLRFSVNPNLKSAEEKTFYFKIVAPKEITTSILRHLDVTAPNKLATIVQLVLKDESPKRGEDILNELINEYNKASIDDKNELSSRTLSIVTDRLTSVQHQVDSIQNLINQYKQNNGIVNLSEQSSLYLKNVGENDQKIADINMQAAVLEEVEKFVNSKDHNTGIVPSTLGVNDPVLSNLLQKLYELESQYDKLKMTATENNPTLISLNGEIEKTRSSILENARIQKISVDASRRNLNSTIDSYSSQLKNIPDKERELVEISRELSVLTGTYDFLLQKKEEASLSYESTVGNSRTVDKAQSTAKPTSPQKSIVFLIAIAAAMAVGFLIVLWKEVFGSKILFRAEIDKYTKIPVIAEILETKKKQKVRNQEQAKTITNEQFRQLAAGMGLYGRNFAKKKLLITSSISGEGKSFVSTNLAQTLARSGKKVILLDFDFRNPNVTRIFNVSEETGVSEFLEGGKEPYEIIKYTPQENLFVAGAGLVSSDKADELILSDKLKDLFNYLEEVFDFIIMDTAPVEPISDAYILSEHCDASLYVVRHAYTPKSIIKLLDQNNNIKTLKNMSIVFNAVKPRGFVKRTYGYGYGFNYHYTYNQKSKQKRA